MNETDVLRRHIAQLEERIEELDAFASSVSHSGAKALRVIADDASPPPNRERRELPFLSFS
jgi:hypothetical protein